MASPNFPLIYACSGCSNAAQLANALAVRADREGIAEMGCISGVGGGVTALVKQARAARYVIALDGCALKCTVACLARAGVRASAHLVLSDRGIRKRQHADFTPEELAALLPEVERLCQSAQTQAPPAAASQSFPDTDIQ